MRIALLACFIVFVTNDNTNNIILPWLPKISDPYGEILKGTPFCDIENK